MFSKVLRGCSIAYERIFVCQNSPWAQWWTINTSTCNIYSNCTSGWYTWTYKFNKEPLRSLLRSKSPAELTRYGLLTVISSSINVLDKKFFDKILKYKIPVTLIYRYLSKKTKSLYKKNPQIVRTAFVRSLAPRLERSAPTSEDRLVMFDALMLVTCSSKHA